MAAGLATSASATNLELKQYHCTNLCAIPVLCSYSGSSLELSYNLSMIARTRLRLVALTSVPDKKNVFCSLKSSINTGCLDYSYKSTTICNSLIDMPQHAGKRNHVMVLYCSFSPDNFFRGGLGHFPVSAKSSNLPVPSKLISSPMSSFSGLYQSLFKTANGSRKKFHMWHPPQKNCKNKGSVPDKDPAMVVVLLGWLGAQQKHLRLYADWYTAKGFHVVTFVLPMKDLLGLKPAQKAEQHIDALTQEVANWLLSKDSGRGTERSVMFHTFSNTGWLSYGVILEKFLEGGLCSKIKGCVVDSAPEPEPNPQVWALGFSTAIMKKRNRHLNAAIASRLQTSGIEMAAVEVEQNNTSFMEAALLEGLVKFFSVVLKLPQIKQRLSQVTSVLRNNQPSCPQLYIFSDADKVIPSKSVEAFMQEQINIGKRVRSCNMKSSPHVDHFRSFPAIYSKQLDSFLDECLQTVPC